MGGCGWWWIDGEGGERWRVLCVRWRVKSGSGRESGVDRRIFGDTVLRPSGEVEGLEYLPEGSLVVECLYRVYWR
jgi:hypothetical protein